MVGVESIFIGLWCLRANHECLKSNFSVHF